MQQAKDNLIAALRERQGDRSLLAFAHELNATPSALNRFLTSQGELGITMARLIVARYPELRDMVTVALLGESFRGSQEEEAVA